MKDNHLNTKHCFSCAHLKGSTTHESYCTHPYFILKYPKKSRRIFYLVIAECNDRFYKQYEFKEEDYYEKR